MKIDLSPEQQLALYEYLGNDDQISGSVTLCDSWEQEALKPVYAQLQESILSALKVQQAQQQAKTAEAFIQNEQRKIDRLRQESVDQTQDQSEQSLKRLLDDAKQEKFNREQGISTKPKRYTHRS